MLGYSSPYTIAVVGAASGIGRSAALLMAARGAHVVCLDRDAGGAAAAAGEITAAGGSAQAHAIEIIDAASQSTASSEVFRDGQLHAVVNCAGITGKTNLKAHEVDPDDSTSFTGSICLGRYSSRRQYCRICSRRTMAGYFIWRLSPARKVMEA